MQSNTHWSRAEDAIIVYFSARKVTRVAVAELLYRRIGSNRDGLEVFQRLNQIRNVELQSGYPDFWDAGREVWDINVMDTWLVYCVFYDDPLWDVLRFDTWEEEIVRVFPANDIAEIRASVQSSVLDRAWLPKCWWFL
ncbi:hypothetical protein MMC28_004337 [Mycoblastus sanguinarius]|nr:hypothetical protein [Mycoblastus sanguinarius]